MAHRRCKHVILQKSDHSLKLSTTVIKAAHKMQRMPIKEAGKNGDTGELLKTKK
jgi:hypothetical protein